MEGTEVSTPDGPKVIESVVAGELVIAVDPSSNDLVERRVVRTFQRPASELVDVTIRYADQNATEVLSGTPEHPLFVPALGDYVPMGELTPGIELRTNGETIAIVVAVERRSGEFTVYNFEVESSHNYFVAPPGSDVAGVLAHNDCKPSMRINLLPKAERISPPPKAAGPRFRNADEALDQLESIQHHQAVRRRSGQGNKIFSTEKSRQRARNSLRDPDSFYDDDE